MKKKTLSVLVGVALLMPCAAAMASMASGPQLCLPDAQKRGPKWWKPSADDAAIQKQFAAGATLGPVGSEAVAQARTLWDRHNERALVRVEVSDVESLDPEDAFVFAVSDASGTRPELLVRFTPLAACPNVATCDGNGVGLGESTIDYAYATGLTSLTWTPLEPQNPMSGRTVSHPWVQAAQKDDGRFRWTLTFAIELPTVGASEIAPGVKVYGSVVDRVEGITSDSELELPVLCESGSPTSDECLMQGVGAIELPDDLPLAVTSSWASLASRC